jgi:branched-subunit amino acid ABC-type transport system permease component
MQMIIPQLANALVYGMLLFLIAAGLSLIFGLMNVVNIAHGSFFMIGAFFGLSMLGWTGNYWLALILAPVPAIMLGVMMERLFMRRLYTRGHLDQVLLTFGFTYIFIDAVRWIWGNEIRDLPAPALLSGAVDFGSFVIPKYRLFIIAFGLGVAVLLWLILERSRIGAMVRASVDDAATAAGLGINVSLLFSIVFAAGVGLAALGGMVVAPVFGVFPGMDIDILIPAFIVVVVGGMGNLKGAFVASLLIGLIDTLGKAYYPDFALFLVYAVMVIVLLTRPQGLFGVSRI